MQKNINPQDEIDLLELVARLYDAFRKNLILSITLPVAGIVIAFFLSPHPTKKFFSHSLIATNLLTKTEGHFLISQFELADSFPGLSSTQKAEILEVTHSVEVQKIQSVDSLKTYIYIDISAKNRDILPEAQQAIYYYLANSTPAQQRKQAGDKYFKKLLSVIDAEIKSLEEQKDLSIASKSYYLDLKERRMTLEMSLGNNNVQQIKGISTEVVESGPSRQLTLLAGFAGGIFALLMVLFLKYFINYYKHHYKSA